MRYFEEAATPCLYAVIHMNVLSQIAGMPSPKTMFSRYTMGKRDLSPCITNGIMTIGEITDEYKLNDKQLIQQASVVSGEPHVDKEAIREFLSSLEYPLYYLDFETSLGLSATGRNKLLEITDRGLIPGCPLP